MLDYSDEETEPQPLRRRNHSPPAAGAEGEKIFYKRPHEFSSKTVSIFQEWKKKSSKLIMPTRAPPIADAFIISEFFSGKALPPTSRLQTFGDKGGNGGGGGGGSGGGLRLAEELPSDFDDHPDSFFKSMRTLVLLAQFFAVLPVSGIRGPNHSFLCFKWIHYKTAFWALSLLGNVFCFGCSTMSGLDDEAFEAASKICYFACGMLSSLLMLNLSRNWKLLNEEFTRVEIKFKKYGYPERIGFKFKVFTVVVLLVALVEHILAKLKNLYMVLACTDHRNEFFSLAESFFKREYAEVFALYTYSFWKGVLLLSAHFLTTANWNFKDLFLCTISWTIAERFKQVHDLLDKVHGQDKPISFWKEVRENYNNLSVLTKRVDSLVRRLMLLSVGNNLFFICIQLFHSLKKKVDSVRLVYFFGSLGFLVLRTGFVAFSAARINDESKEPKTVLYSVPQKNYTAEVRRFLTQLTTNEVALTGSGFFSITRSLILTIIGSIITYEIVLVQFGSTEIENVFEGNRTICL